jgi:hypothetical protein
MPRYTALITRNFRDKEFCPKVLLLEIKEKETGEIYRDHLWVKHTSKIDRFIPRTNKKKISISFDAEECEYISSEGTKKGLARIKNIKFNTKD